MKYSPEELVQLIVSSAMAKAGDLRGLSAEEISELENSYKLQFPEAYKAFLRTMGGSSESVFYSVSFVFPGLAERMDWSVELAEMNDFKIPETAFVFFIDDALFFYFDTTEGDDPPVYRFIEAQGVTKISDSFSQWLSDYVSAEVQLDVLNKKSAKR